MKQFTNQHNVIVKNYREVIQGIIHESKGKPKAVFVVSDRESYYDIYLFTKSLFNLSEARCDDHYSTIRQDNIELMFLGVDPLRDMPKIVALHPTVLIITQAGFENNRIVQYLAFKTREIIYFSPLPTNLL